MTDFESTSSSGDLDPQKLRRRKERNRERLEAERREGRAVLRSYPLQIQIESTNRCPLFCKTCARNYYDEALNPPGDFNPDRFPGLEELFLHAERVLLGGYGEPLIGKHTEKIMRLAAKFGCFSEVITSGVCLDDRWIGVFGGLFLGRIILSVDAATEEGMKRRRGIRLPGVLNALDALKTACPQTKCAFNVTLNVHNLGELSGLVDLAAAHGVDDIFVAHQKIYTRAQRGDSVLSDPGQAAIIFDRCRRRAADKSVGLHLPELSGTHECMQPLELMMIRHDGLALGCCSALFERGTPRIELGRLGEESVDALWNSPQAVNARKRIYGRRHDPGPCDECGFRVFSAEAMNRFLD